MKHVMFLAAVLCTNYLPATIAYAQATDPTWIDSLTVQLALEQQCKAESFIRMREGILGTKRFHEARVQCADGRMFDATRIEPNDKFKITRCEIVVC